MRPSRDEWAMSLAVLTAQRTTCIKRAVGCVLLNERGHVLSTGNNGVAAGQKHCNLEWYVPDGPNPYAVSSPVPILKAYNGLPKMTGKVYPHTCKGHNLPPGQDKCEAIHAEVNALLQCRDVYAIDTAYVTLAPCLSCAKTLLNTSCKRICFLTEFEIFDAKDLWLKAGRLWHQMSSDEQGRLQVDVKMV